MAFLNTCGADYREEHGPHVWVGDLELTAPSAAFGEYSSSNLLRAGCVPCRIAVLPGLILLVHD